MRAIADRSHRVTICSGQDVVNEAGELRLTRVGAWDCWASIVARRPSAFSAAGYAIKEPRESASHEIAIRYRTDKLISAGAWVYEARRKSAPRWFKVLSIRQEGEELILSCRLIERSDEALAPVESAAALGPAALPPGVRL